ncbi:hypothetical protein SLS62_004580 [Diatrype stigma]|uniref:GEgh 16 protein n=1 Tax=Diatrype stigma TaxID=117547 RepID=A0AAN9UWG4_9PEZI
MSLFKVLSLAAFAGLTQAHGVLLNAQGIDGSPNSVGFQGKLRSGTRVGALYGISRDQLANFFIKVDPELPRNCTSINPCQQDTTIIRDAEIAANVVNECGRTELTGNIDIGENTENAIAAGKVTQVQAGTQMTVTIHQVNADGAGPYTCDLIEAGNNGVVSQNLTVENNVPGVNGFSQAKTQDFDIKVTMPDNFNCVGGSTGNVCTVRCRNNAQAGPFGGCFPVEQVDGVASQNTPANIDTAISTDKVFKQVKNDQQDLPAAIAAIQNAGTDEALSQAAAVSSLLKISVTSVPAQVQTPAAAAGGNGNAAATTTAAQATATSSAGNGKGNKGNNNDNNNNNDNANGNSNSGFGNGFGGFGKGFGNNNFNKRSNRRRASVFFA